MYKLRQYQEESSQVILETKIGTPSLIVLPTGAGKTLILANVAAQTKGRVLIVTPSTELREQTLLKLKAFDKNMDVGSVQGKLDQISNKVIVSTRQSLTHKKSKRMMRMLNHGQFELVIIDEAHQACHQIKKIINNLNDDVRICGLTATPWNPEMLEVFNHITYSKSIVDMILDGWLCEPKGIQIHSQTNLNGVKTVAGEFNLGDLENAVNNEDRNKLIVKAYKEHCRGRHATLIFATGIDHIKEIVKKFTEEGIYCKGIDSNYSKEDRAAIIDEFKSGKLRVLVNCGILTAGFDFEQLDSIIFARPCRSKILYCQCLGRGLRLAEGKKDCLVIDIVDILRTHDVCELGTIFDLKMKSGETLKEAIERDENEKKEEEAKQLRFAQLEAERQRKEEEQRYKTERFDLFNIQMLKLLKDETYEWFKVDPITFAISFNSNAHYVIENTDYMYHLYEISTKKEEKYIKKIETSDEMEGIHKILDDKLYWCNNSFALKGSSWKSDKASQAQLQYTKGARTKFEAHVYFASEAIKWILKNKEKYVIVEGLEF